MREHFGVVQSICHFIDITTIPIEHENDCTQEPFSRQDRQQEDKIPLFLPWILVCWAVAACCGILPLPFKVEDGMDQFELSLLGILLAVIYNLTIGSLWYSPMLFGNRWTVLVGNRDDDLQGGMTPGIMLGALTVALVEALGFSFLKNFTGMDGFFGGLFLGLFVWLVFLLPPFFNRVLYEKAPRELFFINAGANLVTFAGMAVIIGIV
jgi:hypothetical protein